MQTKKRKMKAGEALVGMKRSGSQLEKRRVQLATERRCIADFTKLHVPAQAKHGGGRCRLGRRWWGAMMAGAVCAGCQAMRRPQALRVSLRVFETIKNSYYILAVDEALKPGSGGGVGCSIRLVAVDPSARHSSRESLCGAVFYRMLVIVKEKDALSAAQIVKGL